MSILGPFVEIILPSRHRKTTKFQIKTFSILNTAPAKRHVMLRCLCKWVHLCIFWVLFSFLACILACIWHVLCPLWQLSRSKHKYGWGHNNRATETRHAQSNSFVDYKVIKLAPSSAHQKCYYWPQKIHQFFSSFIVPLFIHSKLSQMLMTLQKMSVEWRQKVVKNPNLYETCSDNDIFAVL